MISNPGRKSILNTKVKMESPSEVYLPVLVVHTGDKNAAKLD